jgi:hypothetical protein
MHVNIVCAAVLLVSAPNFWCQEKCHNWCSTSALFHPRYESDFLGETMTDLEPLVIILVGTKGGQFTLEGHLVCLNICVIQMMWLPVTAVFTSVREEIPFFFYILSLSNNLMVNLNAWHIKNSYIIHTWHVFYLIFSFNGMQKFQDVLLYQEKLWVEFSGLRSKRRQHICWFCCVCECRFERERWRERHRQTNKNLVNPVNHCSFHGRDKKVALKLEFPVKGIESLAKALYYSINAAL